jgi:hypothetical protein
MKFLMGIIALVTCLSVSAQTRIVSIDAFDMSYTGGVLFKSDKGQKLKDKDETTLRLNLNYAQNTQYVGLMLKAALHWNRNEIDVGSEDSLDSAFGASAGALYNLEDQDIKNSIFFGGRLGVERATIEIDNKDESGFNLFLIGEFGKRWDLGQYSVANISYAPTVEVMIKRYGGNIRDEFYKSGTELKFLKFDILF